MRHMPANNLDQTIALAGIAVVAVAATAILSVSHAAYFQPYFGSLHPLLAIVLVATTGSVALYFLHARSWFSIYARGTTSRGVALSAALATIFAVVVISLDACVGFPRDLNVPAPWSLLFYPAIGYVAEICFHVIPLTLALFFLSKVFKADNDDRLVWICILLAALPEPIFQLRAGLSEASSSWLSFYVALHVLAFNLLQLYVFRRYDFISMYSFRLVYYLYWHIGWGYLRLQLLF